MRSGGQSVTSGEMSAAIDAVWAAYSAGDLDGFVARCAPDMVYRDNVGEEALRGVEAFRAYAGGWIGASSDRRGSVLRKTVGENRVAAEIRIELTHDRAPIFGVEAAGARIAFDFAMVVDFADDRIAKIVAYWNPAGALRGLGVTQTGDTGRRIAAGESAGPAAPRP